MNLKSYNKKIMKKIMMNKKMMNRIMKKKRRNRIMIT